MYSLYVKTHNQTGLKYLGYTKRDPLKYPGSGFRWQRHIRKHGNDVTTSILLQTESMEEIKSTGVFFSNLWNVADSAEWANLINEEGTGGRTNPAKTSATLKGVLKTEAHKANLRIAFQKPEHKKIRSENVKRARAQQTQEKKTEIGKLGGATRKGKKQSLEHKEKRMTAIRKTYLINKETVVENAKEYCAHNELNYINFTQAAKHGKPYRGKIIEILS